METFKKIVLGSIFVWLQALGMPVGAAGVLAVVVHYGGVVERMSPAMWIVAAPVLYVLWMILLFALSAAEMQLLFRNYRKPRHVIALDKTPEAAEHFRLVLAYLRSYVIRSLPLGSVVSMMPGFGKLYFLSYSPSVHLGEDAFFAGFMYDPDLTIIGRNAVVGGNCVLSAHSMTNKGPGNFVYVSAPIIIGDRATLGGESRVAMGVTVGADAVVEPMSNVTAMTSIPAGEVWGGNPAVFLRKRTDLPGAVEPPTEAATSPAAVAPTAEFDATESAKQIIRRALNFGGAQADAADPVCCEWDSLAQLAIAATISDACGRRLSPAEIVRLKTVADVERALSTATVDRSTGDRNDGGFAEAPTAELPRDVEWLPLLPSDQATRLLAQLPCAANPTAEPFKIVVAASFTAEPLASSLGLWCNGFGIPTDVEFNGFNQVAQALLSPQSPFRRNPKGLNVVLLRVEDLPEAPTAARESLAALLGAIRQYAETGPGTLVVGTLPPPLSNDTPSDRPAVDALRTFWAEESASIPGVVVLDFANVIERIGVSAAHDAQMELAARSPFSVAAYRELGIELARIVRRRHRPRAKVLALDCDNTLWGGVLGEDGFDGIQIGPDGPGRSFQAFQKALRRLREQGVLLVLVSRNEEADVLDVFERHPNMILRRSDVAGVRVNWKPKSQNLQELAAELNLGLDSFVFVDDDPAQRLQVESALPDVHVFPTPSDPAEYSRTLKKLWIFDAERLTDEDGARTAMIRQEGERKKSLDEFGNLDAYLHSLELCVELREADERDLPRVAQLTQKTNQFNLSLRRRTLDEIKSLDDRYRIWVLSARDRFGDYGQVGACLLKYESNGDATLEIDTFLVSCRALGRGVEDAFLEAVLKFARSRELPLVRAPFVVGPRNQPAREFFAKCGFRTVGESFEFEPSTAFAAPRHVRVTSSFDDSPSTALG